MNFGKNPQHDFPKMRGGGATGRLELFRKFIRFGQGMLPLVLNCGWVEVKKVKADNESGEGNSLRHRRNLIWIIFLQIFCLFVL